MMLIILAIRVVMHIPGVFGVIAKAVGCHCMHVPWWTWDVFRFRGGFSCPAPHRQLGCCGLDRFGRSFHVVPKATLICCPCCLV